MTGQRQSQRRLRPQEVRRLVEEYETGSRVTDFAAVYGINRKTVTLILKRHGVQIRTPKLSPDEVDEAAHLYSAGWSLARIGAKFDRQHTVIRDVLVRRGIPRRDSHGRER